MYNEQDREIQKSFRRFVRFAATAVAIMAVLMMLATCAHGQEHFKFQTATVVDFTETEPITGHPVWQVWASSDSLLILIPNARYFSGVLNGYGWIAAMFFMNGWITLRYLPPPGRLYTSTQRFETRTVRTKNFLKDENQRNNHKHRGIPHTNGKDGANGAVARYILARTKPDSALGTGWFTGKPGSFLT